MEQDVGVKRLFSEANIYTVICLLYSLRHILFGDFSLIGRGLFVLFFALSIYLFPWHISSLTHKNRRTRQGSAPSRSPACPDILPSGIGRGILILPPFLSFFNGVFQNVTPIFVPECQIRFSARFRLFFPLFPALSHPGPIYR